MRRFLFILLIVLGGFGGVLGGAQAQPAGRRFVAIAFHDVVDRREELGPDAVSTDQLAAFFDWLVGTGWTVISLDDVAAAGNGRTSLPDKAILLTFDDGYKSLYTRVFPLLKAYRFHAVAALVGSWMQGDPNGTVDYGTAAAPRSNFVTWDQAREMRASGLVEIASHSYALHRGILANPQGNLIAAARTWRYDPATGTYETDAQYRSRIRQDLERSRALIAREIGRAPRAIVWPYGRVSGPALEEAKAAGFSFGIDLNAAPADAGHPLLIPRYFPTLNPGFGAMAESLRFDMQRPETVRAACVALDALAAVAGPEQDDRLGRMIENLRALGANKLIVDGRARRDILSRATWQMHTRLPAEVYIRVPRDAAPGEIADMLRGAAADGIVVDAPMLAGSRDAQDQGSVAANRTALDAATLDPPARSTLDAYRAAAAIDPLLKLVVALPSVGGPPGWADYALVPPAADAAGTEAQAKELRADGWLRPDLAGRTLLTLPADPRVQVDALKRAQRQRAAGFALCPETPLPPPRPLSASFSSATYPYRP
jgi:peptidoglycan/xylan/chitin deacetylase (PgdA/CDA1 family)